MIKRGSKASFMWRGREQTLPVNFKQRDSCSTVLNLFLQPLPLALFRTETVFSNWYYLAVSVFLLQPPDSNADVMCNGQRSPLFILCLKGTLWLQYFVGLLEVSLNLISKLGGSFFPAVYKICKSERSVTHSIPSYIILMMAGSFKEWITWSNWIFSRIKCPWLYIKVITEPHPVSQSLIFIDKTST